MHAVLLQKILEHISKIIVGSNQRQMRNELGQTLCQVKGVTQKLMNMMHIFIKRLEGEAPDQCPNLSHK